jgi:hypothetical protein
LKSLTATCAILGSALLLTGCDTVKYPGTVDVTAPSAIDLTVETEPDTANQANAQYNRHRLVATIRLPGSPVTPVGSAMIAEDHFPVTLVPPLNIPVTDGLPDDVTITITAAARDDESGIKEIRVAGITKLCQGDPATGTARQVDYQGNREWLKKDYAPTGPGNIPKQALIQNKVAIASLMRATSANGTLVHGDNALFQFSVEVTNGGGLKSYSQLLAYGVGTIACP